MMTLRQFSAQVAAIPATTGWYLADLGEARGKQELFARQSLQKLKALREHALIESAVSSNRIEGVEVERKRVATLVFGTPVLKDRDEEEVRGYRDALNLIHTEGANMAVSEQTVRDLHRTCRGQVWDAGEYKQNESEIIEKLPGGGERVRFRPLSVAETPSAMAELMGLWERCLKERWVHPLVALGAFNLDFLCIHPFRDGNGRVSRLLVLLQCYHLGLEVGRYISPERLIEQNKERYYETLEQCSQGWQEGKHNAWPFINYLLWILKKAYGELEERLGRVEAPSGAKGELVVSALRRMKGDFRIAQLQDRCPGVSVDTIRHVLKDLKQQGKVKCLGRGRSALWRKAGT